MIHAAQARPGLAAPPAEDAEGATASLEAPDG